MNDWDLLQSYARENSEDSFTALVNRHLDLVYSAALRQVRSPELAEEVAQSVFVDLARSAHKLKPNAVLAAWLYQVTRRTAIDAVRRDSRRQFRERLASEMTEMNPTSSDWTHIEPLLEAAMDTLDETDRSAILLRYFQNKSLREVGQELGTSEDAAQKRVSRAVERLRGFFSKRGVSVGASGLVVALSGNAVQSAPVGLGSTISSAAVLSGAAVHQATTLGVTKVIVMTTMQKTLITAAIVAAVGTGIYEARRASHFQNEIQALQEQQALPDGQISQLRQELDAATNQLALARQEIEQLRRDTAELPKLRGDLARLRSEAQTKPSGGKAETPSMESAAKSWLARVDQLKQRFEQMPDQKIPEFQLLEERDWLNAAKGNFETDEDYRRAMGNLRGAGENKFAIMAQSALKEYARANNAQFPTSLSQLQPYFKPPVDDAILQRYAILPAAAVENLGMGGDWIVTQLALVDNEYDQRYGIGPNGFGSCVNKGSAINTLGPALKAFAAANNGQPPTDPAQLQPYVTTPAQQEALQKATQFLGSKGKH